ncbi:MobA/MobL family protein [Rhizobium sp. PP-F2F-G36]|nr:MobA/MobL family protein [Rhizobium sp. PP-F2F-G36]
MASYHLSAQIIGRKAGRSSVAAAAYRAGEKLHDQRNGQEFDFSRRRGVAERAILMPEGAAEWLADRTRLWNHVEVLEKRKDAQLVREINVALPHELDHAGRVELVKGFVREQFVSRGMVADIAWHDPVAEKGDDPRNFHAHIMLTLRQAGPDGLRRVKTREWNSDELMKTWRKAWADHQNRALGQAQVPQRVDHRSLETQRQDAQARGDRPAAERLHRLPEIHIGPKARASERKRSAAPQSRAYRRSTARSAGGSWRSSKVPEKRQRAVDYQRIDQGSRSAYGAAVINRNIRDSFQRVDKFERQAARLRARETRASRVLTVAGLPKAQQARYGVSVTPGSIVMARRHQRRSSALLRDIERLLADLLQVRDLWGRRYRSVMRQKDFQIVREGGGGRSRDRR